MKYFNVQKINLSIRAIRETNSTQEHVTSRATSGLLHNYFGGGPFTITPEQIQVFTRRKPDYAVERIVPNSDIRLCFIPHCFAEVKSLVGRSIDAAHDQLIATITVAIDDMGNITGSFSTFLIAMKGVRIAIYAYHNIGPLLDDYGIYNYKGLIPLNYVIPRNQYLELNRNYFGKEQLYTKYTNGMTFETNSSILSQLGVQGTNNIPHPHVFDLSNPNHFEHIHRMFVYIATHTAEIATAV